MSAAKTNCPHALIHTHSMSAAKTNCPQCIDYVDAWPWLDAHHFELVPHPYYQGERGSNKNMISINIEVYRSCGKKPSGGFGNGPKFGSQWKASLDVM